jgi:hypothetical protein
LNFEHIISGHKNPQNAFSPRYGKYTLHVLPDGKSVMLARRREHDPWAMSSTRNYTVSKPHYIDVEFRCVSHDPALFGKRRYAILLADLWAAGSRAVVKRVSNLWSHVISFKNLLRAAEIARRGKRFRPPGPTIRPGASVRVAARTLPWTAASSCTINRQGEQFDYRARNLRRQLKSGRF